MSVGLFLFYRYVHLCHISDSTHKWYHMVFVSFFMTSRSLPICQSLGPAMFQQMALFHYFLGLIIIPLYILLLLFSRWVVSESLQLHGLYHTRLPHPSLSPGVCSNACPLSQWCYLPSSSSVTPFCSCLQSFPASGSFLVSRLFTSGGQTTGASASASVLPMNIQGWFPLGLTGLIFL